MTISNSDSKPHDRTPHGVFISRALIGAALVAIGWATYVRAPAGERTGTVIVFVLAAAMLIVSARMFRQMPANPAATPEKTPEPENEDRELSAEVQQMFAPVRPGPVVPPFLPRRRLPAGKRRQHLLFSRRPDHRIADLERLLEELRNVAQTAKTKSESAETNAATAVATARQLEDNAVTIKKTADAAATATKKVAGDASKAQDTAEKAIAAAGKAATAAGEAKRAAGEAKQAAEQAQETAAGASETALKAQQETERTRELRDEFKKSVDEMSSRIELLLGTRDAILGVGADETASTLVTSVRSRYLLILRSRAFREKLVEAASSFELRHALRHLHELIVLSTRLLSRRLPPATAQLRHAHWSKLHEGAVLRFLGMMPFLNRVAALPAAEDEAAVSEGLRGLTASEEKFGWACVPMPRSDDPPPIDDAAAGAHFRNSAAKVLEFAVTPVVLLAQELFEALPVEDPSVDAPSQFTYETGTFAGDSAHDSIDLAVQRAAAVLGFEYVPIRLYEILHGRANRFISRTEHQRVSSNEWFGDDRPLDGPAILRFHRPAFKIAGTTSLLNDGADVLIGVQPDAPRS